MVHQKRVSKSLIAEMNNHTVDNHEVSTLRNCCNSQTVIYESEINRKGWIGNCCNSQIIIYEAETNWKNRSVSYNFCDKLHQIFHRNTKWLTVLSPTIPDWCVLPRTSFSPWALVACTVVLALTLPICVLPSHQHDLSTLIIVVNCVMATLEYLRHGIPITLGKR